MPSKATFFLIAALAASVSALPTGTVDAAAPVAGGDVVPPVVNQAGDGSVQAPRPHLHHPHTGPHHAHHHAHHHVHHAPAPAVVPPQDTTGTVQMTRREYYESLYPRHPTGHGGHGGHFGHEGHGAHGHGHFGHGGHFPHHGDHHNHHGHHNQQPVDQAQPEAPPPDAAAPAADPNAPQRRELDLEERNFLQAIGLQAYVSNLTVKQNEKMQKAKKVCDGLTSKKDQKHCNKEVDKIIQLTKERNYRVEQFIKLTNHHDIFASSDPSSSSSSSSSSSIRL